MHIQLFPAFLSYQSALLSKGYFYMAFGGQRESVGHPLSVLSWVFPLVSTLGLSVCCVSHTHKHPHTLTFTDAHTHTHTAIHFTPLPTLSFGSLNRTITLSIFSLWSIVFVPSVQKAFMGKPSLSLLSTLSSQLHSHCTI